jgi:acetylglutamate kinase
LSAWAGQGVVPVLSPMSLGADGEIYNVNADHVAGALAAAMDADLLTFVTNVPGVLDANNVLQPSLTAAQTQALIADGTIFGGMIPKVRTAPEALEAGVSRVRITNLDGLASGGGTVFSLVPMSTQA